MPSTLVPPSIEMFLSGELLCLVPIVDLPALYRELLFTRRPRMIGVHGQVFWFHAAAELIERPGRKPELAGVMNDITSLERAEERVRAFSSRLMRLQDDERRRASRRWA